jgi:5-methylcytosine-specific restriction protein A
MKPKKRCNYSSCKNLIDYDLKFCIKHEREDGKEYNKLIRNNQENKKYSDFYSSKEWRTLRKLFIIDHPLCIYCLDEGSIKLAEIIHHKEEIKENFNKRLDRDNLESVCRIHHNKIHKQ